MRSGLEIYKKINEINLDILTISNQKTDNIADNVIKVAAVSSAKKQIELLKWVLNN